MTRMKDYKPNFRDGQPTDAFKRRSSMYRFVVRPDGTTAWKLKPLAEQALALMAQRQQAAALKKG